MNCSIVKRTCNIHSSNILKEASYHLKAKIVENECWYRRYRFLNSPVIVCRKERIFLLKRIGSQLVVPCRCCCHREWHDKVVVCIPFVPLCIYPNASFSICGVHITHRKASTAHKDLFEWKGCCTVAARKQAIVRTVL